MLYNLFGITWASAEYSLYLLPLALFIVLLLIKRVLWQKRTAALLGYGQAEVPERAGLMAPLGKEPRPEPLRYFSLFLKVLKAMLLTIALVTLILALARPQWDDNSQIVAQEGRDVLIALDISRSMLAQDIKPSRLEAAKEKIKELVGQFHAERVALMVFSGIPFIQCPFTQDVSAFLSFLNAVDVESVSSGSTALDKALQKALETFSAMPTKKHKIVLIFTDGEDFSTSLSGMEEKVKALGLSVFTIGIGTAEGAPIPLYDEKGKLEGHVKDEKGSIVITRLNEPLLKKLSQQTGARYIRATSDGSDVDRLVGEVKHFEKEKFEDKLLSTKQEKYFIFAGLSFICLLLEWLI